MKNYRFLKGTKLSDIEKNNFSVICYRNVHVYLKNWSILIVDIRWYIDVGSFQLLLNKEYEISLSNFSASAFNKERKKKKTMKNPNGNILLLFIQLNLHKLIQTELKITKIKHMQGNNIYARCTYRKNICKCWFFPTHDASTERKKTCW